MFRSTSLILAATLLMGAAASAQPAPAPAPAQPAPTGATAPKAALSTQSTIGELLANPAAAAILDKHMPGISQNPQMQTPEAAPFRFADLKPMAPDVFTDKVLAAIDADLAALPKN